MYGKTIVQNLIVFNVYYLLTDSLREFDLNNTLIHFE